MRVYRKRCGSLSASAVFSFIVDDDLAAAYHITQCLLRALCVVLMRLGASISARRTFTCSRSTAQQACLRRLCGRRAATTRAASKTMARILLSSKLSPPPAARRGGIDDTLPPIALTAPCQAPHAVPAHRFFAPIE